MHRSFCRRAFAAASLVLAVACSAFAQDFRATLTGRVADPNGAAVPAAQVTVTNQQTNEETTTTTNEDGNYTVPLLKPNDYTVTVSASGFNTAVNRDVTLFTGATRTLDVALAVGAVEQTVTVTADTAALDVDSATRGQVIENARINELPLIGRNPLNLTDLATGVQFNGNPSFRRPFDNGDNVQFSINGGLLRTNEFLLDGAPNNAATDVDGARTRSSNNIAFVPSAEATQEFRVQTNTYDAQYGRTGGGVVNITLKSGGNQFNGSIYEFLQRYQLTANSFENNRFGRPRFARDPVTGENLGGNKLDQFGGVLSGPMLLPIRSDANGRPAFYNGRNKTFFLVTYEKYIQTTPSPGFTDVPTLLERQGNFSQSGVTIFDPATTRPDPANPNRFIRDPFPGNIIPANRINPIGQSIVNAFSLPNIGGANQRFDNFLLSPNLENDDFYSTAIRIDQNFGENTRLFGRYVRNRRDQVALGDNRRIGLGIDAQDPLFRINDGIVIDGVRNLNATSTLNLRASYSRFNQAAFRQRSSPFDATTLGFPASFNDARPVSIVPRIEFDQYRAFGPRNPNYNITNTIGVQGNYTTIIGGHTIKAGADFRNLRVNQGGGSFTFGGGFFRFTRGFTQQNPQVEVATQGSAIASLLLGVPAEGRVENIAPLSFNWNYLAPYIQDDWKVTPRLTLNLGFRYDFEAPPVERFNRQNRGFAFDQSNPVEAQARAAYAAAFNANPANFAGLPSPDQFRVRGGLLFAGENGQPDEVFDRDVNNFQPRIGVAFQLDERTVLRGGYGIYYFPQAEFGGAAGFSISTPFVSTIGGGAAGFTPANNLSNPFPTGLLQPFGAGLGLLTQAGQGIIFNSPERVTPFIQQYSFGIQREVAGRVKLDVSYVGSASRDVLTGPQAGGSTSFRNINVPTVEQIARANADPNFFNAQVANPFQGLLPGNAALNGATVARRQLLLPFPQFTSVQQGIENVGRLDYNSLQASAETRLTSGLVTVASYTFSKNIGALGFLNDQDPEPARFVTDFDRTHVLALSGVYRLPFGRGQAFSFGGSKLADLLLGGFDYSFNARLQSGRPINLSGDADLIADPTLPGGDPDRYFNNCVLRSPGVATQPRITTPGTVPNSFEPCTNPAWAIRTANRGPFALRTTPLRLANLREPWTPLIDMALNKSIFFTERYRLQIRGESFNTFNSALFGAPNTNPNNPNFGFINRASVIQPRVVQLGFKFLF